MPAATCGRRNELAARALDAAQALDAVQSDCDTTLSADFHSFRRAFNTALAALGVNVQTAMALAGHKSTQTHLRNADLLQRAPPEMPEGDIPALGVFAQAAAGTDRPSRRFQSRSAGICW